MWELDSVKNGSAESGSLVATRGEGENKNKWRGAEQVKKEASRVREETFQTQRETRSLVTLSPKKDIGTKKQEMWKLQRSGDGEFRKYTTTVLAYTYTWYFIYVYIDNCKNLYLTGGEATGPSPNEEKCGAINSLKQ